MNIIDKALEPFAPVTVARRLAARQAIATIQAYEAARPTRTHRANSETRSGNEAVRVAGKALRDQARYLDENHDIVTGLFDRLEERVIGRGINVEPVPLNMDGSVNDELRAQIKLAWAEWSVRPEVERMVCRTWLRDGEALGNHIIGAYGGLEFPSSIEYAIEILEPDYLPLQFQDVNRRIRQGVEFSEWGRPVAYHVHRTHPADTIALESDLKRIPAAYVSHIATRKRIGQARGVSLLAPALIRLADLKDYEESERVAARIAAALTLFIKKGDASLYGSGQAGEQDAATGARTIPIAPGMVFDGLQPGEDVGTLESNRPSALLEGFRDAMLRAVASGTRVGYSTLSRNYNGTYSAQRQELVESQLGYVVLQQQFIDQWSRGIYRRWLPVAMRAKGIKIPPSLNRDTLSNAVYSGPVMPWIDPTKEATAWRDLVSAGFATEQEVARARGQDPAELRTTRKSEIEANRADGLVFDSDAFHKLGGAGNAATD
ncbi:MAG TPA: phage portal protein, partial [Acidimicrobiia bacterium]